MSSGRFLFIHFNITDNGDSLELIRNNPEFIFEEIIKEPVFTVHYGGANYFSSAGDYRQEMYASGRTITLGKLVKSEPNVLSIREFDAQTQEFVEKKIPLDNDILDSHSTNFYFVHHKQLLIIEDSYDISINTALRFFYHACERYIGGNFEIKTEFQQNIDEILANTSIKNVKVKIERPNPISPEDIEIVRDLFTKSNSTHITIQMDNSEKSIHIAEHTLLRHAINLALIGYGFINIKYVDTSEKEREFDSRKDLLKYDFDNLPESMDERASWILENFEMLGV